MSYRMKLIVPLVSLVACGDDKSSTPDPDAQTGDTTDAQAEVEVPSGCTPLSPSELGALVFDGQDDVSTSYSYPLTVALGVPAADYLVFQFFNYNERIDAGAGTFPLDEAPNDNFGTCPECVAIWVDQPTPSLPPGKFLFQSSGSIRLDVDPRTRRLIGRLEGVVFREIALDEMTLSSTFVDGGDCVALTAPLDFELRWVPDAWTCGDATYYTEDGCDCGCGEIDPDCYPGFDSPALVASTDCSGGDLCFLDRCVSLCEAGAGGEPVVACDTGELCTLQWPDDVCQPRDAVDAAALGAACTNAQATYCAVSGSVPTGVCAYDEARLCRPLCASRADCAEGEHCYTIAGSYLDGQGKGYCNDGAPPTWWCEAGRWEDGATCDCDCGDGDPDCLNAALPIEGCDGARCGADGACPE